MSPVEIRNERSRFPDDALNEDECKQLRTATGQLNWAANQAKPDIAYEACQAIISFKDARVKDVKKVNKVIRKLKNERVSLKILVILNNVKFFVLVILHIEIYQMKDHKGAISYFFVINKIQWSQFSGSQKSPSCCTQYSSCGMFGTA